MMKLKTYPLVIALFALFLLSSSVHAQTAEPELKKASDLIYNLKFDEAEKVLNQFISNNPSNPRGYLVRGILYDWKQEILEKNRESLNEKSLEDLERANKLAFLIWNKDQDNIPKMVNLANTYMFLSKKWLDLGKKSRAGLVLKKSKKHLNKAIEEDPNYMEAYLASGVFNFYVANIPSGLKFLAKIMGMNGDEKLGLERLKKAATEENLFQNEARFVLSYALGKSKRQYKKALPYIDEVIKRFPDNYYFLHKKGIYASRSAELEASREVFQDFLKVCESKKLDYPCSQELRFLANFYIVESFFNKKGEPEYEGVEPYLKAAKKLDQGETKWRTQNVLYWEGLAHKLRGESKKANEIFKKVLSQKEESPYAHKMSRQYLQ